MADTKIFKSKTILAGLNAKTIKGDKRELYATAIMYLAPYTMAGRNVCPMAETAGCIKGCLVNSGQAAVFSSINKARVAKTRRYLDNRVDFMAELVRDIERFVVWCAKHGVKPAVRLNGTSDIQWEVAHPCHRYVRTEGGKHVYTAFASIFAAFPEVQFYDYTKVYKRAYRTMPSNYSLTLSYSEANPAYADAVIGAARDTGMNMAVVYRTKALRDAIAASGGDHFHGATRVTNRRVIDGDETDMRFTDPKGVIVGLYAKGRNAKADTSGFVIG